MIVKAVKTKRIEGSSDQITEIIKESVKEVGEQSVIAVSSKVVALCEGNYVPMDSVDKDTLIVNEAQWYLPKTKSKYDVFLTIKGNMLVPSSGVDESNTGGYYVLWPKDPQKSVNTIWEELRGHYKVKNLGVIITDSVSSPLRWGVTGRCVAYCGFEGVKNLIHKPDLFGRTLQKTKVNVADALAASAVFCMGESDEQTPLAVISELDNVTFCDHVPSKEELEKLIINIEDDIYGPLLKSVNWLKGGK
ncbi:MAG: putative folate metabolism gamma-glutamate ligase [Clostridiaceae bacterium]|nr:putative folate metabolism gamma-glutamate ligase [Clostridiaceae bacterium]